jgi:AcrR family transcriptional regulator
MLDEMAVADVTLNGLSRRACMAKSNVLRYFESREAVLLELHTDAMTEWVDAVDGALVSGMDAAEPVTLRANALTRILTSTLAERPLLCNLISVQASVLEHNVSTDGVIGFKRASIANVERLSRLVMRHLPELSADDAARFTAIAAMLAASVWLHSHPPAAVEAAYEADETLRPYRMDFSVALPDALDVVLAGLIRQ